MTWPSNSSSISLHGRMRGDHLKSFRKMTSLSSTPSHAYEQVAGDRTVLNSTLSGSSIHVSPQFAGPVIYTFRPLPRPKTSNVTIVSVNTTLSMAFLSRMSSAQSSHWPLQMYWILTCCRKISNLVSLLHSCFPLAVSISHTR